MVYISTIILLSYNLSYLGKQFYGNANQNSLFNLVLSGDSFGNYKEGLQYGDIKNNIDINSMGSLKENVFSDEMMNIGLDVSDKSFDQYGSKHFYKEGNKIYQKTMR